MRKNFIIVILNLMVVFLFSTCSLGTLTDARAHLKNEERFKTELGIAINHVNEKFSGQLFIFNLEYEDIIAIPSLKLDLELRTMLASLGIAVKKEIDISDFIMAIRLHGMMTAAEHTVNPQWGADIIYNIYYDNIILMYNVIKLYYLRASVWNQIEKIDQFTFRENIGYLFGIDLGRDVFELGLFYTFRETGTDVRGTKVIPYFGYSRKF